MPLGKPIQNALPEMMPADRYDLTELTAAESIWLWRHRQRATNGRLLGRSGSAMNQDEAATALGISTAAYRALELGGSTSLSAVDVRSMFAALGSLRPTVGELCITSRRRSGLPLSAVVELAGVSRPWYLGLERRGDTSVVELWRSRGFRFPFDIRTYAVGSTFSDTSPTVTVNDIVTQRDGAYRSVPRAEEK